MTDVEKIIKALEHHKDTWVCNGCPYEDDPDVGNGKCPVYDDAIALLREQEPVRPIEEPYQIVCGSCGEKLAEIDGDVNVVWNDDGKYPRFCPGCGREVKWDD